jgi:hypothetical protein
VRVLLRADSGFAREALMAWCETNRVDDLFGLARNRRLVAEIEAELQAAAELSRETCKPARRFKDLIWSTRDSWSRERRVIAKAEWTGARPTRVSLSLRYANALSSSNSPPLNQSTRSNPIRPPARIAANKDEASASNPAGERAAPSSMRPNTCPARDRRPRRTCRRPAG